MLLFEVGEGREVVVWVERRQEAGGGVAAGGDVW